jgi:hypothetical protein
MYSTAIESLGTSCAKEIIAVGMKRKQLAETQLTTAAAQHFAQ